MTPVAQRFRLDTEIIFGPGSVRRLPEEGLRFGMKVLMVTGKYSLRRNGILDRVVAMLEAAGLKVVLFAEVEPEPSLGTVARGLSLAGTGEVDWVVGMGGGSAMDAAKAIAGLYRHPGEIKEYFQGKPVDEPGLPFIAIPTTAGSGAEVTVNAVLSDPDSLEKKSIRGRSLAAKLAIVDPELTVDNSPRVTAYSGFDALVQAIEAFTSTGANSLTDIYALEAVEKIGAYLYRAYSDGTDCEARAAVSLGSLMAGIALGNARLGAVHGLAHPLGIRTGKPHGLVCAVLLLPVMRFNLAVCYEKYARIAKALGHSIAGMDPIDAAAVGMKTIMTLRKNLGISSRIGSLGVTEADFPDIARASLMSGSSLKANPREVKYEDLINILKENF